jgi:hypothetical protein
VLSGQKALTVLHLQNIGGEYTMGVAGATFAAGANYDTDAKDLTPTASISFNF